MKLNLVVNPSPKNKPMVGKKSGKIKLALLSFGYKYGLPANVNLVLDVRFLQNPYFKEEFRLKNGRDEAVQKYVLQQPSCRIFLKQIGGLLSFLIREYKKKGKNSLVVACGCTGGQHRSVAVVEALKRFSKKNKIPVTVQHRDLA